MQKCENIKVLTFLYKRVQSWVNKFAFEYLEIYSKKSQTSENINLNENYIVN